MKGCRFKIIIIIISYGAQLLDIKINYIYPIAMLIIYTYFFVNFRGWTLGTAATTGLQYQPQMIGEGDCGEIGGIKIDRGNRSTWRKPAPAPLCPPQIPHD
jgi:hypothetical protein